MAVPRTVHQEIVPPIGNPHVEGVVSTNPARCRDCYRCVRACPVKAVRVTAGQACVVAELCLACASCVRVCPQNAKVVRDDRVRVKQALARGQTVVASVAPSAPAFFEMTSFAQMEETKNAVSSIKTKRITTISIFILGFPLGK